MMKNGNKNKIILERLRKFHKNTKFDTCPPFPREILIEVANICNLSCVFCAYSKMTRPKGVIDPDVFVNILTQAYHLGAREVGLYGGSEPLTCKDLEKHIETCRKVGYEYIYITTNGILADEKQLQNLIDAGLDSIKFSINAGDRETYKIIHGKDHFDKVCKNIVFVDKYRQSLDRALYLAITFVETEDNTDSYDNFYQLFGSVADEIVYTKAYNCSGQMPNLPKMPIDGYCSIPFNRVIITKEGYLRVCCNDYQNYLAVEDLNLVSLKEAWVSERFVRFRKNILENNLDDTLCFNCMNGCHELVKPLNPDLSSLGMI